MIENLLDELQAGTLDLVEVQRLTTRDDTWFVARAELRAAPNFRIFEMGETAHQAVKRLYSRLEEAYLEPRDPMEPDYEQLAQDADEPERMQAEGPAVQ